MEQMWGILDTKDNVWIGNEEQPIVVENEDTAVVCARIVNVQLGWPPDRAKAAPYNDKLVLKRDSLPTKMRPVEALRRLEEGSEL